MVDDKKHLLTTIIALIAILVLDLVTPLGIAVGLLYVIIPILLIRTSKPGYIKIFSLISSALIIGNVFLNGGLQEADYKIWSNRVISFVALWLITLLILRFKKIQDQAIENEKKFHSIVDAANDAVITADSESKITSWNPGAEQIFGWTEKEALGQSLTMIMPDKFKGEHLAGMERYISTGKAKALGKVIELRGIRKNGREFPVELSLGSWKMNNQVYFCGFIRDITERKKAERQFKALLESAPDAMVLVDYSGDIRYINNQTEKLFKYTRDELIGRPVETLIPDRFGHAHKKHRDEFYRKPKVRIMGSGMELYGKKSDNIEFPVEISLSPIETEGEILVSAAIRDVTDRMLVQTELNKNNIELKAKNQELEQFTYIASHDLQEPLRTMRSFVEMILKNHKKEFSKEAESYLNYILDASDRMKALIRGLLDYSRLGQNRELLPVSCQKVLEDVLTDLKVKISESKAKIEVHDLPTIRGYEVELRLLFQNLINNAIKFRKPDKNPQINIDVRQNGESWIFSVEDNGIGFSEMDKEKIFKIFHRLHTTGEYSGMGIGLAHCKKIAELHGGTIWAESQQYKGSTFFVSLPR